jgi:hypothetical protein
VAARATWFPPTVCAALAALSFVVVQPAVGDLWAARAHESAVVHGVEPEYWFSWFAGAAAPGGYSVLTPYAAAVVGSAVLGAVATVSVTPLVHLLARGTAHPLAATWTATLVAGVSLWSGRVPFALGSAIAVVALLAVRANRRFAAVAFGALTALASPVCGAFLVLGLAGAVALQAGRRVASMLAAGAAALVLGVTAWRFGVPGPEPFNASQGRAVALSLLLLLIARPAKQVTAVLLLCLAGCPMLVLVPNGLGSNFERMSWIWLPVATVATAQVEVSVAALAAAAALFYGVSGTARDLQVALSPVSSPTRYVALTAALDRIPDLASYRVEAVPDGTHAAAYALLQHASLARGYETQADHALNGVLMRRTLTAAQYRAWLDRNAVGYVILDRLSVHANPELRLVRAGLGYLHQIWSDADWRLYRVSAAQPIVTRPSRVTDADQSRLVIRVASTAPVVVRVRWSPYLSVDGPTGGRARIDAGADGWTVLRAQTAGTYVLSA